jgi:ATP-dependent Clp endopeptidase proteolytic subunit ClpP
MSKNYYSIQNKTEKSVDILIYGVIGDSWFEESVTARKFFADFKALEKEYERINIRINSPGGSVWDGLSIFNTIRNSSADTHTYNDGLCASRGAAILMAGKTVHAADNSLMMIHSPSTGVWGNAKELKQVMEALDKVQEGLIACFTNRNTAKTAEEIKTAYFDYADHWLTADEAIEENFVDEIEKGTKKVSDKVKSMSHDQVVAQIESLVKGRTLFDRFFSQAHDFFSPNQDTDMNLKKLITACGLPEDATEQDVLDWIAEHGTPAEEVEEAEENEEEEESEEEEATEEAPDTDPKDQEIAKLKAQLDAIKKGPGAQNKKVAKATDAKTGQQDQFKTSQRAKDTFDAVNKMFE